MRSKLVPILLNSVPGWVRSNYGLLVPSVVTHFDEGRAWVQGVGSVDPATLITTVRASNETTLWPSSASGAAYQTFLSNIPAIVSGSGLQAFQAATNLLLNSTAPVTQTTASLGTGTYTLWVNGSGSATSSAGSATGSGFGAATNGTPNTFTLTGAGTVTVTVSGSLNAFQLQSGSVGTALVVTAGATATQAADAITMANGTLPLTVSVFASAVLGSTTGGNALIGWGTASPNRAHIANSGGSPLFSHDSAGFNIVPSGTWVAGTLGKMAARNQSGSYAVTFNGLALATSANAGGPNPMSKVTLGTNADGTAWLNGYLRRVAIFNSALTNAQLQALTT